MPRLLQFALAPGQAWHRPKARANLDGDKGDFKNNQAKRTSAKSGMLAAQEERVGGGKEVGNVPRALSTSYKSRGYVPKCAELLVMFVA